VPDPRSMDREGLQLARQALVTNWNIALSGDAAENLNWQLLLDALEERILNLLERNPQRLLTAVYLLDISESRYNEAMSGANLRDNARSLAQVILERESAKIAMRRRYHESASGSGPDLGRKDLNVLSQGIDTDMNCACD